jgi:iron complex outermembrane receptor protein
MKTRLLALSLVTSSFAFADDVRKLSPTVVTATRYESNSFDLPLSIDAVTGSEIRDARTGANLSEIAPRIPGVVINYRSTAAQELSISTRGFGARSQFGVKGIRIYADGIPLNSADGQGQAGSINLDTLGQIEFLRGPFSALYGNSSGGVVQAFTRDGAKDPTITVGASSGTWNTNKQSITYEGQAGPVNYILNAYQYVSDGYRDFSQYRRDNFNGKISYQFNPDTKFTFVGNYMDQPYTNDPNALTPSEFASNSLSSGTGARDKNTRLYRINSYGGIIIDHNLSEKDSLRFMAYSGERTNLQYLLTSAAAEIKRETEGFDFRWTRKDLFLNRPLNFTAGLAYDAMKDIRSRYSYPGTDVYEPLGYNTKTNRREKQTAFSADQYLQASYEPTDRLLVIAGLRHSRVNIKNEDLWLGETTNSAIGGTAAPVDSSGQVTYTNTSPVAGVTFKVTPTLNVYANYGRGFETPTFAETTYSNTSGAGPNLSMVPTKSKNYEIGLKAFVTSNTRVNVAFFKVDTKNEIVVTNSASGQNVYGSSANTERKGIEFSLDSRLPYNFNFYQTYTYLDSEFKNSFLNYVGSNNSTSVAVGNRLAGVYKNTAYTELSWKYPALNFSSAIENIYYSDVNGYDSNAADRKADAFSIVNLRASIRQSYNNWSFSEFLRADNILDEKYVGNVRVNNTATFEPGAPRNYTVGITSSYTFK